jgi:hypothetical protein
MVRIPDFHFPVLSADEMLRGRNAGIVASYLALRMELYAHYHRIDLHITRSS